jgi:hypothetical protein
MIVHILHLVIACTLSRQLCVWPFHTIRQPMNDYVERKKSISIYLFIYFFSYCLIVSLLIFFFLFYIYIYSRYKEGCAVSVQLLKNCRWSIAQLFTGALTTLTPIPPTLHCKKKRRIINPHYAFMTAKWVYESDLPFHKPFFLEKVGKGLWPVANPYTLLLVSLLINSFCIDERSQP